jgi:hypothetical protein
MNKKLLLAIFICGLCAQVRAQAPKIDTVAVFLLDRMSAMIGDLHSCSVSINSTYDINSREFGLIKHSDSHELYLHGANKLLVTSEGDKGTNNIMYNGTVLTYYSHDKNQYGQIAIEAPVMSMIDSVNKAYGIVFPAADFFYPTFVDDILAEAKNLAFLGMTKVGGKDCFHIAGTAKDKTFQFWISDDAFYLPVKVVIVYTGQENRPQYESTFSNWQINPELPDALFEFSAPPLAKKIKMVPVPVKK